MSHTSAQPRSGGQLLRDALVGTFVALAVPQLVVAQPFAYVANSGSHTVSVIDTATDLVVATIPVGQTPEDVAVGFGGARVYVCNVDSASVSVIDASSNTVIATVPVGANPHGVAVTPDGDRVYVASTGAGTVSVIDAATNTVIQSVPVAGAHGIVASPDGTRIYITSLPPSRFFVLDTATNTLVGTQVPLAAGPALRVAVTGDGLQAFATHFGSNEVTIVDTLTREPLTVQVTGAMSRSLLGADASDATRVWLTDLANDTVVALSPSTAVVLAEYAVGLDPMDVVATPDGNRLYVTSHASNSVTVLNLTTFNTSTINVGMRPAGVAIADTAIRRRFSNFETATDVSFGLPDGAQLTLWASVTPAADSDGVQPLTESLSLAAGTFLITIPAGGFQVVSPTVLYFTGPIGHLTVQAAIQSLGGTSFLVVIQARGPIPPIATPLRVVLSIGNDSGGRHSRRGVIW